MTDMGEIDAYGTVIPVLSDERNSDHQVLQVVQMVPRAYLSRSQSGEPIRRRHAAAHAVPLLAATPPPHLDVVSGRHSPALTVW
jgi:hypothetical protein